jgi:hypothetical protein
MAYDQSLLYRVVVCESRSDLFSDSYVELDHSDHEIICWESGKYADRENDRGKNDREVIVVDQGVCSPRDIIRIDYNDYPQMPELDTQYPAFLDRLH